MSAIALAERVDAAASRGAFVNESVSSLIVSNMPLADTLEVIKSCADVAFAYSCSDKEGTEFSPAELDSAFEPFKVTITKPTLANGALPVLSAEGFSNLLSQGAQYSQWWVAGLSTPIRTWQSSFLPWGKVEASQPPVATKSPRYLVREYTTDRTVASDVAPWLLRDADQEVEIDGSYQRIWAECATRALVYCLPNEIDPDNRSLKFRGPPRLVLSKPESEDISQFIASKGFRELQAASAWVFENERETEARHALLAAEIGRSGIGDQAATAFIQKDMRVAFDGARIAYEMALAAVGADTLKALSDLRKSVTEDTAKVTEATRQTIVAVFGAIAVGIGLIAAKAATQSTSDVISYLMIFAFIYVFIVAATGAQFVVLQRSLRSDWRPRLYRFIPEDEYEKLVKVPTLKAEIAFWLAALAGVLAVAILSGMILWPDLFHAPAPSA